MRGLRVGIIGAGRSGTAAARLLKRLGASVLVSDHARIGSPRLPNVDYESGGHSNRLLSSDLIIRSPGVPGHLPILKKIIKKGISVWSELELASRYTTRQNLVAITGTNGKTTTTRLVGALFAATQEPILVAGNIGTPLSDVAMKSTAKTTVVLEVSSYQLENIESFHPHVSAILNITPDHLEHHGSMRAYAEAKARIFENQTAEDFCIVNREDAWCRRLAKGCPARVVFFSNRRKLKHGVFMDGPDIVVRLKSGLHRWRLESQLPGPHNVENILASVAIAVVSGVPLRTIRQVLNRFRGVEHRLEWVRSLRGIRYVNDSKATNVDSTRVALESFTNPLILIMGGEGKGSPYTPLKSLIRAHVRHLLLIGDDTPRIYKEFSGIVPIQKLGSMRKAVSRAAQLATAGDVVLLSPACASFDQYNNYEERGRDFKRLVQNLK